MFLFQEFQEYWELWLAFRKMEWTICSAAKLRSSELMTSFCFKSTCCSCTELLNRHRHGFGMHLLFPSWKLDSGCIHHIFQRIDCCLASFKTFESFLKIWAARLQSCGRLLKNLPGYSPTKDGCWQWGHVLYGLSSITSHRSRFAWRTYMCLFYVFVSQSKTIRVLYCISYKCSVVLLNTAYQTYGVWPSHVPGLVWSNNSFSFSWVHLSSRFQSQKMKPSEDINKTTQSLWIIFCTISAADSIVFFFFFVCNGFDQIRTQENSTKEQSWLLRLWRHGFFPHQIRFGHQLSDQCSKHWPTTKACNSCKQSNYWIYKATHTETMNLMSESICTCSKMLHSSKKCPIQLELKVCWQTSSSVVCDSAWIDALTL